MYNCTIRTIASILLVSHTLMSCFNSELAVPGKECSLEEKAHYLETSIDTQIITELAERERVGYDQGITLQPSRLDIQPLMQGSILNTSLIPEQTPIDLPVYKPQRLSTTSDLKSQPISSPFIQSEDLTNPFLTISKGKSQQAYKPQENITTTNSTKRIHKPHVKLQTFNQLQQYQQHTQARRDSKEAAVAQKKYVEKGDFKEAKQSGGDLSVIPRNILPACCFDKQIAVQRQLLNHLLQGNRQGHYQLARVQENLVPFHQLGGQLASVNGSLTAPIQIRGGHQVSFIQDAGYWWGILQENRFPGFSRILTLPVLYPRAQLVGLSCQLEYTVESLLSASPEAQRQLLHVIFPEKVAQKIGFLYTGREMGVEGGFFLEALAIGTLVYCVYKLVVKPVIYVAKETIKYFQRKIERDKILTNLSKLISDVAKEEEKIENSIKRLINKIDDDPQSYKIITPTLSEVDNHKIYTLDNISKLEKLKKSNCLLEEDVDRINDHIKAREKMLYYIDKYKEEIKQKARKQALAAFKKKQDNCNSKTQTRFNKLKNAINFIASPQGFSTANENFQPLMKRIEKNINFYEAFKKEPALFAEDLDSIDNLIKGEKEERTENLLLGDLIAYATKNNGENVMKIQMIANSKTFEEVRKHAVAAIKNGQLFLLHYLIRYKGLSVYDVVWGKTLLEYAKAADKRDIVDYLLKHGANK